MKLASRELSINTLFAFPSIGSPNVLNSGFKPITTSYPPVNNYVGNPQSYTSAASNVNVSAIYVHNFDSKRGEMVFYAFASGV